MPHRAWNNTTCIHDLGKPTRSNANAHEARRKEGKGWGARPQVTDLQQKAWWLEPQVTDLLGKAWWPRRRPGGLG